MRRDPTRIEVKLEDIQEYEQMKREMESKKNKIFGTDTDNSPTAEEAKANDDKEASEKSRTEMIHRRIGFDPTPRVS